MVAGPRLCRTEDKIFLDIFDAAGMDETYSTYVDDECVNIHGYDDDTDDTDDDTVKLSQVKSSQGQSLNQN